MGVTFFGILGFVILILPLVLGVDGVIRIITHEKKDENGQKVHLIVGIIETVLAILLIVAIVVFGFFAFSALSSMT